ncbi:hypothetical protein [Streptomyces thermodiastaticus]|uniref:hypothetical protein n=1 Tax=Streptomyces thermodiastaticus TaxID=44061 RepID=UPI001676AFB5|nr:hypothetical protein [Streptomyces thermodiastaticus]MCE7550054.1 hypothetical protein [Streptomyces thermodiastaticus]GHF67003.1 hypothetical protein GCM10018787_14220 [Streptomyces thermodiastaticus]
MPPFRRPPEWEQPAHRHTQLNDPVLTVRQLSRFELSLKHVVRIDHALVFSTPKGGYEAYLPPRRPTRTEIASHRYTAVYEVDMGVHTWTSTFPLPSDNDAFEFTAEVDLSWQVLDPAVFVASGHRDVPGLLTGTLQQAARPVSRRFAISDSAAAEQELLRALESLEPLGATAGLRARWTLRLKRDQANIDHQLRLQAIDHSAAEQVRAAQRGMEVDAELDRRAREQDRLQFERATTYGRQHAELTLQQQNWQYQIAAQQAQHALAMQQYEAAKIKFYQWHLQQGGVQAWALHLAQHPEDTQLVMNTMRDDQLRMIQAQLDLVTQLLSGDNTEKFELEGPKQLALRTVTDILNQRLPGVAQNPPLIPSSPQAAPSSAKTDEDAQGDSTVAPESPTTAPAGYAVPGVPSPGTHPHLGPTTPGLASAPSSLPGPPPPTAAPGTPVPAPPYVPPPPPATAWQAPPGYGTLPTVPPKPEAPPVPSQQNAEAAAADTEADGTASDSSGGAAS